MKTTKTIYTEQTNTKVTYELRAENRKLILYASVKDSNFYEIKGGISKNDKSYKYMDDARLTKELGMKGTRVYVPNIGTTDLKKELQQQIIEKNDIIHVSYLHHHLDFVCDYELECNLIESEREQYRTGGNDSKTYYEIPAKNLYIERKYKGDTNAKTICVSCQQEYDIIENNGKCTHCGF